MQRCPRLFLERHFDSCPALPLRRQESHSVDVYINSTNWPGEKGKCARVVTQSHASPAQLPIPIPTEHTETRQAFSSLKLALAQRIHHVWNWTADDKFSSFWWWSCSRREKNQKGSIEQRAKNRQRRPTMQPFIKTCSAFKLDAANAHLQGSSALSRLGSNTTPISTNTRESVSDWRSVEYIWYTTVTTVFISCHNTEKCSDFKHCLKTSVKKAHFRPSGFCAAVSSLLWADKRQG